MPHDTHYQEDDEEDEFAEAYLGDYASIRSIVGEALPFQLVATFGGVASGIVLSGMTDELQMIPGLIVIAPAVLGMRGNISSTLGSRLGSAIHMGLITKIERNPELINNVNGSLLLSALMSFILGLLGHFITVALGMQSAGPLTLTLIAVLAGVSSGLILAVVAVFLALGMFRFGFDPDNVVTPAIATVGDIVSMIMIFLSARVVLLL